MSFVKTTWVDGSAPAITAAQLNRMETGIDDAVNFAVPAGGIIMWSGSIGSVPSGWALCDGSSGTPDLRDRFVVGAGTTYAVNDTGGANTVTLATTQVPGHTHTFSGSTNTTGAHTHTVRGNSFVTGAFGGAGVSAANPADVTTSSNGNHSHTFSGTTASTGGGQAHENRPPYLALAFIMKL